MIECFHLVKNSKSPKRSPGQAKFYQIEPNDGEHTTPPVLSDCERKSCGGWDVQVSLQILQFWWSCSKELARRPQHPCQGSEEARISTELHGSVTWMIMITTREWSLSSKQASSHGKRTSSPSARGSREPWKCSGEEVEEDSAFLQEPSPLSSQVVLNDFRSMIYWYMWESWSHQRVCSGSSLFCQLPLPELGDGLQRHSWLDIREEYNVFNNVGRIRETYKW